MNNLFYIAKLLFLAERRPLLIGLTLSAVVLLMGVALLGLSGWFITAAAAAGIAGIGILFNVFAPSAMVRFLALGRTVARYGERLSTHDAVLRALSALRVRLLTGLLRWPHRQLERLRADAMLNRVTADIDALDGVLLRLVLPGLAGGLTLLLVTGVLAWLVDPLVALIVGPGYLIGANCVFFLGQRLARTPARQAEAALQATRRRLIQMVTAREDLTVYGQIDAAAAQCHHASERFGAARQKLDRIERRSGLGMDIAGGAIVALALGTGAALAQAGHLNAASAAIGVFAALALAETVAPILRALTEIGRMAQAARRVRPMLAEPAGPPPIPPAARAPVSLRLTALAGRGGAGGSDLFTPVDLCLKPGETAALTGPSGSGKSTVLLMVAGALPPAGGQVILGADDGQEAVIDGPQPQIAMVPQRHGLIAGTVAQNLRLGAPGASDDRLWAALRAACLDHVITARGGLEAPLGFRGAGLSGGEARRLVLARAILRNPAILLLDEPTEGLDDKTARAVMLGVRQALPEAMILMAAHRPAEIEAADQRIRIGAPEARPLGAA